MKKNKQIFLVGLSDCDFMSISIEAINAINKSQCLVLSQNFPENHIKNLEKLCNKIFYEQELVKNHPKILWKKIKNKFREFDIISHIKINDPIFFSDGVEESVFFEKHDISVEIISGTIGIVELLNKSKRPLTNRKKNSSLTFLFESKQFSLKKIISLSNTDKLIVNILNEYDIEQLITELRMQKKFKKISFINKKIFQDISKKTDSLRKLIKFSDKKNLNNYLILEKNE